MAETRQSVECPVCLHDSPFTLSNVVGDAMLCISCGEEIAEITRATQESVDVLRCQPFSGLKELIS